MNVNEFAAQSHAGPAAPPEHAGLAEFKVALAQAGGRPPLDRAGHRMQWNSERGWHTRGEGLAPTGPRVALTAEYWREVAESQRRRAEAAASRAWTAQLIRESRTLREAAAVRLEAPFSDMGQLLRAGLL
jgi:hypothetical protein